MVLWRTHFECRTAQKNVEDSFAIPLWCNNIQEIQIKVLSLKKNQPRVNRITENWVNEAKILLHVSAKTSICAWYVPFKGLILQKTSKLSHLLIIILQWEDVALKKKNYSKCSTFSAANDMTVCLFWYISMGQFTVEHNGALLLITEKYIDNDF